MSNFRLSRGLCASVARMLRGCSTFVTPNPPISLVFPTSPLAHWKWNLNQEDSLLASPFSLQGPRRPPEAFCGSRLFENPAAAHARASVVPGSSSALSTPVPCRAHARAESAFLRLDACCRGRQHSQSIENELQLSVDRHGGHPPETTFPGLAERGAHAPS